MELLRIVIPLLAALAILAARRRSPALWVRARLPLLIFLSIGSAVLVVILMVAACVMVQRELFSAAERALYCVVDAGLIGFITWINLSGWRKWHRERGDRP